VVRRLYSGVMRFPAEQALYGAHYAKATLEAGSRRFAIWARGLRFAGSEMHPAGMIPGPRMLVANYAIGATGAMRIRTRYRRSELHRWVPSGGVQWSGMRAAVRYQIKLART